MSEIIEKIEKNEDVYLARMLAKQKEENAKLTEEELLKVKCRKLLVWAGLKQLESKLVDWQRVQEVCNALLEMIEQKEKEVLE